MTDTIWIDIETRSRVDLKRFGVYRYVRCPDWKILMASYATSKDGPIDTALTEDEIRDIPGLWDPRVRKVAMNAPFERINFSEQQRRWGTREDGYLPPEEWHDPATVAARWGYSRSLDGAAKSLGATPKDSAGTRLINLFCKPNRKGEWNDHTTHPEEWLEFIAYCEQDVGTLREVDLLLEEEGNWPTPMEREINLVDQYINDRGIAIDVPMARKAASIAEQVTEEQKDRVRELTLWEVENPGSRNQILAWFESEGLHLPNLKQETVERALLTEDMSPVVREVLELRQELALAAPAKFSSALSTQVDGRLHGTLLDFGAHTGRWAGKGTQPHNLPRASFKPTDEDIATIEAMVALEAEKAALEQFEAEAVARVTEAAIGRLMAGENVSALDLKRMVRAMFIVDGVVVDYSAIEARVIAWLAGEEWALQAFRDQRDIYVETARQMGPQYNRSQGKIAVLALGYNGGPGSLKAMATDRDFVDINGEQVMLSKAPNEFLYEMFVWPWRDTNSNIVRLWGQLDRKFRSGGPVGDHLEFRKAHGNRDRLLYLPSGRPIGYRKAGIQKRKKMNHKGQLVERDVLTFWSPQGHRDDTYGGRLAENATQAVARDIMAEALVRLHKAGLQPVAHVHDEIIVQGTKDVDLVTEIMCQLPDWATGLPIDGEGFSTYRYKKG